MLISALLNKLRVNFRDVSYHYFSPKSGTHSRHSWRSQTLPFCPTGVLEFSWTIRLGTSGRSLFVFSRFTVLKQNLFLFSTNSWHFLGVAYALISLILKFFPLSRVNFLYWGVNLPSNRVKLSCVNLKYVN